MSIKERAESIMLCLNNVCNTGYTLQKCDYNFIDKQINEIKKEAADEGVVNQCKMIPQKPDCRGYTDTFFCTNCQLHIHLGFIGQRYGGNYCIECGAEVEDGDAE